MMKNNTTSQDPCDIIVLSLTKEWEEKMFNQFITKPKFTQIQWEKPLYSKNQIEKAGKIIANKDSSQEEHENALQVLNNWRASHAYPLQVITSNLRKNNPNAIVVQRLKRLDSIVGKIERFPTMNLYKMQDLGGCRVIVENIDEVYKSVNKYKDSRIRHKFIKENDYIQNPKESGYRSYHMVYQFHSESNDTYNKNMFIEIQFRTQLQHIWATAVEMMGIYTKSNLKSSQGNEDILRFFVLVSSVFAKMENMPICPNTVDDINTLIKEIKEIDNKLKLVSRLSALSVAINYTTKNVKNAGYYVLQLDYSKKMLRVHPFKNSQIEVATNAYNKIEALKNSNLDVVLVSAKSFDTLKAAYPNYFVDISAFVNTMRRILT